MFSLTSIKHWLLPSACVLCSNPIKDDLDLCALCQAELPWIETPCQQCALPLPNHVTSQRCGTCLHHTAPYEKIISLFSYEDPVNQFITRLKFQHQLVYARLLSQLFLKKFSATYLQQEKPACIIPIPLHYKRLRERGFNQAVEIAKPIAKKLKIPLDLRSWSRIKATQAQTELSAKDRAHNIKNAFVLHKKTFNAKYVVVFDDVITTGHTVTEFCSLLRENGVEKIEVWCCARTAGDNRLGANFSTYS